MNDLDLKVKDIFSLVTELPPFGERVNNSAFHLFFLWLFVFFCLSL